MTIDGMPEIATERVLAFLDAMERRALDEAARYVAAEGLVLVFPGGRRFTRLDEVRNNSAGRYRVVKKRIRATDSWMAGEDERVLVTGTLFGEWPCGTPFEGIRFVDLFDLRGGLIVRQEVWNDTGERIEELRRNEAACTTS